MRGAGVLTLLGLALAGLVAAQAPPTDRAEAQARKRKEAVDLVAAAKKEPSRAAFEKAAASFESLAAMESLAADLREELRRAAFDLKGVARLDAVARRAFDPGPYLELLERAGGARPSSGPPLGLEFQGSYTQTKVPEVVYGGHASAMGPPPMEAPAAGGAPSPVTFVERPCLDVKTYCGGPSKNHILESGGSGIALFDYDGDGRLDVYVVNAYELTASRERIPHRNALYHNLGGFRFEDVSKKAGVAAAAWGNGVCAGDFDDDGRLDLYVTNWGTNALYRNNGDGTFTDVAAKAGVAVQGWSTGCAFFDADGDGDLDLYVARYVHTSWEDVATAQKTLRWRGGPAVMVGPTGLPGEADLFLENRGDGSFAEATEVHGLADAARGYGFGVLATDYDDDGKVDLFVANDSTPNFLYHNVGKGRFESVGLASGVAVNGDGRAQAGMGVDSGDYDGDGRLDLVLTTFAHDVKTVFRNLGQGLFEDASRPSGLAAPTFEPMGWGVGFLDADLDGWLDLFIANGHIYPEVDDYPALKETFRQKAQLFLNEKGVLRDVSASAGPGLQLRKSARGLAVGDLDGDGDMDVVMSNMDDTPTVLENRQQTGHHWIGIRLRKPGKNRFAIGARVTVLSNGRRQIREVRSGGSFLSQSELDAHFGVGDDAKPVVVEIRVPGGGTWRFVDLAVDRVHEIALEEARRAP